MSNRAGLLQNLASPIGIAITGGVLAGVFYLAKGDEIKESVQQVKSTVTSFMNFAQPVQEATEKNSKVEKPAARAASSSRLSTWEEVQPKQP